VKINFLKLG